LENIVSSNIDVLLNGISGLSKKRLIELLEKDVVDELGEIGDRISINFFLNDTLYASDKLTSLLLSLRNALAQRGYLNYLVEYDYDEPNSFFLNDNLSRSFIPKNIWFIHDSHYDVLRRNLEDTVRLSAYKNIHKFAECDEEIRNHIKLPLVTIAITNYNYENYLEECVQSILDLNYPNLQTIIVDDCSTDGSHTIIEKYKDRFNIVRHEKNSGQLAAFFSAMKVAQGEFVIFVDADDTLDFNAVSAHLSVHLYAKPYVSFSCTRNRQISADGSLLSVHHLDFQNHSEKIKYIKPRAIHTPTWSWSTTSAMMFRSDMLRLIETDKTDAFRICADYYVVNFSNLLGASMLFDVPISNYRRHGKNNFSKNFIIGGHKPTGHLKYHGHPEHVILSNEIADKLILQREKFEPYFGNIGHYATVISYVMPISQLLKRSDLPRDIAEFLRNNKRRLEWENKKLIYARDFKLWLAKKNCFIKSVKGFVGFIDKTYCEK